MLARTKSLDPVSVIRQTSSKILTTTFEINIHDGSKNETFTLSKNCSDNTTILEIKQLIISEKSLSNIDGIILSYNNEILDNTKTLFDYNIIDNRHLIYMSNTEIPDDNAPAPPTQDAPDIPNDTNNDTLKVTVSDAYITELETFKEKPIQTNSYNINDICENIDFEKIAICCVGVLVFFCFIGLDLTAIIFGASNKDPCGFIEHKIGKSKSGKDSKMTMKSYLIWGGSVCLASIVVSFGIQIFKGGNSDFSGRMGMFMWVYGLIWSIYGFIIYGKTDDLCKQTSIGKMVLSYAIIKLLSDVCLCCGVAVAIFKN